MTITTQRGLRVAFWATQPSWVYRRGWKQNAYATDLRVAWCDFIEFMLRDGQIREALAQRATL